MPPLECEWRRLLDVRKNPFFRHASLAPFLMRQDGRPAARATIVIDRQGVPPMSASLGFFECLDASRISAERFRAIVRHCIQHEARLIQGPFNPNLFGEIGLQISAFGASPSYFQPYNPPYYVRLFEEAGFRETHRLCTASSPDFSNSIQRRFPFMKSDPAFPDFV